MPIESIRINIDKKEIYPNQKRIFNTGLRQYTLQIKHRLLGGVRLKQEESKVIKLEEKKLNPDQNNELILMRNRSTDTVPVDN